MSPDVPTEGWLAVDLLTLIASDRESPKTDSTLADPSPGAALSMNAGEFEGHCTQNQWPCYVSRALRGLVANLRATRVQLGDVLHILHQVLASAGQVRTGPGPQLCKRKQCRRRSEPGKSEPSRQEPRHKSPALAGAEQRAAIVPMGGALMPSPGTLGLSIAAKLPRLVSYS